jgi:hypothetical protein
VKNQPKTKTKTGFGFRRFFVVPKWLKKRRLKVKAVHQATLPRKFKRARP